jgi:hypothetical protein
MPLSQRSLGSAVVVLVISALILNGAVIQTHTTMYEGALG